MNIIGGPIFIHSRFFLVFLTHHCQPLTLKPPPPCNVVFNLKAPLGDEKPNQTISARFSLSPITEYKRLLIVNHFKVKQEYFHIKN